MTPDDNQPRLERDNSLVSQFVQRVIDRRRDYYDWIQEEVKDSLIRARYIEVTYSGKVKRQAKRVAGRLRSIHTNELVEITNDIKARCADIGAGGWNDRNPMDAYYYLEEGLSHYKDIVQELIRLRKSLDGLVDGNSA